MSSSYRQRIGRRGEDLACQALEHRGYAIIARNWRCGAGEVDIVARDGDCWVFVEVKTRRSRTLGVPELALTSPKLARLRMAALQYLGEHGLDQVDWRIDLTAIELDGRGEPERLHVVAGIEAL
ncbi:MAG: YraN family protein [Chloroflexota bacterium]